MELLAWMEQWRMLPESGGMILCALSGGRDSVCLLHYLMKLASERGFSVAAAHFNHQMRPAAERDEAFCRELCCKWEIPFYAGRGDVLSEAADHGWSKEEAARQLRYRFLEATAREIRADRIATAHHLSDQAETVLLNLLRGTGAEGLGGIPPVRGKLIRPLLQTTREEIDAYLAEYGLSYVDDETNAQDCYTRNRLRLQIMPELERLSPRATEHIARTAQLIRRESAYLDELAAGYLTGGKLSAQTLLSAPAVLQPRILRLMLRDTGAGQRDYGAVHYKAMLALAKSGGVLDLPGGMRALCRNGDFFLQTKNHAPTEKILDGEISWGEYNISISKKTKKISDNSVTIRLNCDKITSAVWVRSFRGDDRLTLPAARGSRSVKRLLAERGIPPEGRTQIPVICVGDRVAAVYGVGTDEYFVPQGGKTVEIHICKNCGRI